MSRTSYAINGLILFIILFSGGCISNRPKTTIQIEAPIGEKPQYRVTIEM